MLTMKNLPDVASQDTASHTSTLQWVGMEAIALPIKLDLNGVGSQLINSKVDLYVSLDSPDTKGIHMSRLYLQMNKLLANQTLNKESLAHLLSQMAESQQGISKAARINLSFDVMLKRSALLSGEQGYQSYPIVIDAIWQDNQLQLQLQMTIPYSSTCPCSASLSRQLYSEAIDQKFAGESIDKAALLSWLQSSAGSIATPHSQRSYVYLKLDLSGQPFEQLPSLISRFEEALGTPVQTAVKRSDEQEFARLNAQNLMFCEDAARRIKGSLEALEGISDYWFKVEHQESLHAHNAVVIDQKYPRSQ